MDEGAPKKVVWVKITLMLVVLTPFISSLFFFIYWFWFRGVTFTK